MKLKLLVAIVSAVIGEREKDADMYLPMWLLVFGVILIALCPVLVVLYFVKKLIIFLPLAVAALLLGSLAVACWRNQSIKILSDTEFCYTTFLGNKRVYKFADITALRRNNDSCTLFVAGDKVHIENCAVMSDRLLDMLDASLNEQ